MFVCVDMFVGVCLCFIDYGVLVLLCSLVFVFVGVTRV